jgi:Cu2+-exporting ATPase
MDEHEHNKDIISSHKMHKMPEIRHQHEHGEHVAAKEHVEHEGKQHKGHDGHQHMVSDYRKRFFVSLIFTVPVLMLSPVIQKFLGLAELLRFRGDSYVLFALSSFVFFFGGYPFLKGLYSEIRSLRPGMMTLIGLAITVAYVYSSTVVFGLMGEIFFWELVTLIDIMLLGHWIEMKSIMGASRALEELVKLLPSEVHKITSDGGVVDIPLSELRTGDRVIVKPGEKIPADGDVIDGETSVNESMLTGESRPVPKKIGAKVIGGSINGEGSITVEIKRTGKESFLSQVIELVREAQQSRSRTQDLANRAALWLTIVAIAGGAITLFVWVVIMSKDFTFAIERAVTVMVIACPHALGLAVPLVVAVSTAISAKSGLLVRDRAAFERARNIQAIVFDKTGTLTEGKFGVTDVVTLSKDMNDKELLKYAASVEAHSEHSIAKGIVGSSSERYPVKEFKAIPGKGAEGRVNGKDVKIVSPGYIREHGVSLDDKRIEELTSQGKTVVFVMVDGELNGAIALADIIRPESKQAISMLNKMGIKTMMLTGDNEKVAKWVSRELGIDEYFAEVLPKEKVAKIKEVQSRGLVVAMTGDGVNDAPSLAQADVGIAIGAGTDVAVETADIILVKSNPIDAVAIIGLARATYRKMVQNLAWATGYNVVAIPLAAGVLYYYGVLLTPALGAVFMSVSTVIVAINSRFLKVTQ